MLHRAAACTVVGCLLHISLSDTGKGFWLLLLLFSPFSLLWSETSQLSDFISSVCYYSLDISQNHDSRIKPSFQEVDQKELEVYYLGLSLMKANKWCVVFGFPLFCVICFSHTEVLVPIWFAGAVSFLHLAGGAFSHFVLHLHGVGFHRGAGELPCVVFCLFLLNIKLSYHPGCGTSIPQALLNLEDSFILWVGPSNKRH